MRSQEEKDAQKAKAPERQDVYSPDRRAVCWRATYVTQPKTGRKGWLYVYDDGIGVVRFDEDRVEN